MKGWLVVAVTASVLLGAAPGWAAGVEVLVDAGGSGDYATIGEAVDATKTDEDQWLHLPDEMLDILRWHVNRLPAGPMANSELLFPSTKGHFRSPSVLDKPFRAISTEIGLSYRVSPKGMRRTFQDLVTRAISGHATETMHHLYSTVGAEEMRASIRRVLQVGGLTAPK